MFTHKILFNIQFKNLFFRMKHWLIFYLKKFMIELIKNKIFRMKYYNLGPALAKCW